MNVGDSGGPMWTREGKVKGDELGYLVIQCVRSLQFLFIFFLVGVVSAGAGVGDCANLNNPGDKDLFGVNTIN